IRQEAEAIYPPLRSIAHTVPYPFIVPELPSAVARAETRAQLQLPLDVPVVGNAGWLIKRKRFDVFLRVAQEVLRHPPETLFVIAGDGRERANLEALASQLGIEKQIRWLGWQPDL